MSHMENSKKKMGKIYIFLCILNALQLYQNCKLNNAIHTKNYQKLWRFSVTFLTISPWLAYNFKFLFTSTQLTFFASSPAVNLSEPNPFPKFDYIKQ